MGAAMTPNKRKQTVPASPATAHTALVSKKQGKQRVVQKDDDEDSNEVKDVLEDIMKRSMQRKSLPLGCTIEPDATSEEPPSEWRLSKRSVIRNMEILVPNGRHHFLIENPGTGALWKKDYVQRLVDLEVNLQHTSYCRYGAPYQKHTSFLTSLAVRLARKCSAKDRCSNVDDDGRHLGQVQGMSAAEKNSIPKDLVSEILCFWLRECCSHVGARPLVVDVFEGWGSVTSVAVNLRHDVKVYGNDIRRKRANSMGDFDMAYFNMNSLLFLALSRFVETEEEERIVFDNRLSPLVAAHLLGFNILFWLSTPCETYSRAATTKRHRTRTGHALTSEAARADKMNISLLQWLDAACLKKAKKYNI